MARLAFTLIELLVVLVIIAILAGLTMIGMGNVLQQAKVQRSVSAFVQATTLAKQLALANRRVYSMPINSAKSPGTLANGLSPLSINGDDRSYANLRYYAGTGWWDDNGGGPFLQHSMSTPAPLWSDKPQDQWYCIMGPWQDANGRWWQARGGMPRRDKLSQRRTGEASVAANTDGQLGGCFGPANSDPTTVLGGTSNSFDSGQSYPTERIAAPADWATAWQWDPYGVQVGPRRFLERGTRWVAMFDYPEWAAMGTNGAGSPLTSNQRAYGYLTAAFQNALPAHVTAGRSKNGNEWTETTTFNFYPAGTIDRGAVVQADAYSLAGSGPDTRPQYFIGICSNVTKPATFQPYTFSTDPPSDSGSPISYNRPVAMTWITLFTSGEVVVSRAPRMFQ